MMKSGEGTRVFLPATESFMAITNIFKTVPDLEEQRPISTRNI